MSWLALRPLIVHRQHALTRLKVWQEANISYGRGPTHWILSHNGHAPRTLSTTAIYTVLTPPAVFAGLVFSLWFYKCCIMILFQNKIIYMPSIPPFSRSEKLADYARPCLPVVWREEKLKTADGVELSLCIASTGSHGSTRPHERHVIILYFQGNGSSLPPRLPYLSDVLKPLSKSSDVGKSFSARYTILALSYRGFWSSQGRPSQRGIEQDAAAAIDWTIGTYGSNGEHIKMVLWGQSIGAGVATTAAARYPSSRRPRIPGLAISGLILETPFTSVKDMLTTLYPQKWLPYRYLWPFLWNWWDSKQALHSLGQSRARESLSVLILQAGKDELVPTKHGMELEDLCKRNGIGVQRKEIAGALHTEVMARAQGRRAVVSFLEDIGAG